MKTLVCGHCGERDLLLNDETNLLRCPRCDIPVSVDEAKDQAAVYMANLELGKSPFIQLTPEEARKPSFVFSEEGSG